METLFLRDVGLCVCVSALLAVVASGLGQPVVIAYLAAGVLLGPNGFHFIAQEANIELISEIGVILLMFILGQEINIGRLARSGRYVAVTGILQFLLCFGAGLILFTFLGFKSGGGSFDSIYLSYVFALSSTMVVIKTLSERFDLDTLVSRITVGVLVIQDLWAITFLAMQPNFSDPKPVELLWSVAKGVLMVGGTFGAAKFVLPAVFRRITHQPEMVLIVAMGWCFAITGLSDVLKLSKEMGALLAGVALATFPFHVDVAAKISSLRDFFVTLFFVGLGLRIPIPTPEIARTAIIVSLSLVASRFLGVFLPLYAMKLGLRTSLIPAINLGQLSEFGPILLALGAQLGHVKSDALSLMILVLVMTVALSSYTMLHAHEISGFLSRVLRLVGFRDLPSAGEGGDAEVVHKPKIVLLGFFRDASSLLYELLSEEPREFRNQILVVDYNPVSHHRLKRLGINCSYGDIGNPDTLLHHDLSETELVVCTIPDQVLRGTTNMRILRWLREKLPTAKLVMTAQTLDEARELYKHGADYVYCPRILGGRGLVAALQALRAGDGERLKTVHQEELSARLEILP